MLNFLRLFVFVSFFFVGCKEDEPYQNEYLVSTYQTLLDGLVLDCPSDTSDYYFKATIAGQETCYYDGVDGKKLKLAITSKFTTGSPSLNTGEVYDDARRGAFLSIENFPNVQGEDYVSFWFPDFPLEKDTIEYLDSLFSIEYHQVMSDREEADRIKVELIMTDMRTATGGINFPISSRFGNQDDSYVRFRKVEADRHNGKIIYSIEMEVECNLYHWPQNGKEGLWGKIEDGEFVGTAIPQ